MITLVLMFFAANILLAQIIFFLDCYYTLLDAIVMIILLNIIYNILIIYPLILRHRGWL